MRSDPRQLARLATVQGEIAKALEAELLRCERDIAALLSAREALHDAYRAGMAMRLPFMEEGLRRIVRNEKSLEEARQLAQRLRRNLLDARVREQSFADRSQRLRQVMDRKAEEVEALESLAIEAKAFRKPGVII